MRRRLVICCVLVVVVVKANQFDTILPSYLNPCHSAGYSDDAALLPDEALDLNHDQEEKEKKKAGNDESKARERRGAVAGVWRLWDHAVIPYEIDASFTGYQRALFMNAFRQWEERTCLSFVPKEPVHDNWIIITKGDCGCSSFVGNKRLGGQGLSIGRGCDKFGIILHELGHTIGYWHEQSRPDRDEYVLVKLDNVAAGRGYNFNRQPEYEIDSRGEPYDFNSIMHYSSHQFSKNRGAQTIIPRPSAKMFIGQRVALSDGDVRQTKKMYRCPKCGETLQNSKGRFTTPMKKYAGMVCQWRIHVSPGEKVTFNITSMFIPKSSSAKSSVCAKGYVEVRDGYWKKSPLIGRYCGFKIPPPFTSTGNRVWIEFKILTDIGAVDMQYDVVCGGELTAEEGMLTSPNYPGFYKSNKECYWSITLDKEWRILIRFEVFEIELSDNCEFDYLLIKDGCRLDSPILGRFCGGTIPDDIVSSSNEICLSFASDDSVHKQGFVFHYNKVV
ncbi:bone morphogenetic protein 1-like [Lineus longissimus]|uniref:bone morphogenetic protein 1-like n=1 Tax=Lineus longissimus TaxID=88925 RepID=UPI002B4EDAEE